MLTVGDEFPQFSVQACTGTEKEDIKLLTSADYSGKWTVFFFYPKDFTFVCPTELAEFNKQLKSFSDRDTSVVGGSTDNEWCHYDVATITCRLKRSCIPTDCSPKAGCRTRYTRANRGILPAGNIYCRSERRDPMG